MTGPSEKSALWDICTVAREGLSLVRKSEKNGTTTKIQISLEVN